MGVTMEDFKENQFTNLCQCISALEETQLRYKQTEQALTNLLKIIELGKKEWESTVDSLPDLVCLLDINCLVLRANRTVESWRLGLVTETKGMQFHQLLHPRCDDQGCYLKLFLSKAWEDFRTGVAIEGEYEDFLLKKYFHIQAQPVLSANVTYGNELASSFAAIVITDITDRKIMEQALKESEEQRKLTAIKTLKDLMVTLSHHIRNSNMVIGGFTNRLIRKITDEALQRDLKLMQQASQEIDVVINSLHNLTEIVKIKYTEDGMATMIDIKNELETRLNTISPLK